MEAINNPVPKDPITQVHTFDDTLLCSQKFSSLLKRRTDLETKYSPVKNDAPSAMFDR